MNRKKYIKGEFGYPQYETRKVIIRTILYFALSVAIFAMGYISTGKRENLLTVVAVFGLLPSSKSLVSMIMYLRIPKFNEEIYRLVEVKKGNVHVIYSMYLTSYKENFPMNCFVVKGNNIIGFSEFEKCNPTACEEHIKELLKQNSMKNITVKIFKDLKKFENRLEQLETIEVGEREAEAIRLLCDISL